jgi:mono/diheme cytochrome c family protein
MMSPRVGSGLAIVACIALSLAGGRILLDRASLLSDEASAAGLMLRLQEVRWLEDQMDHGGGVYPMPESMMPDMPEPGTHRLNVELQLRNDSSSKQEFHAEELVLVSTSGVERAPSGGEVPRITLQPRQVVNLYLQYDVEDEERGDLRLSWRRGARERGLLAVAHPPDHDFSEDLPVVDWPSRVEDLPEGDRERGHEIYGVKQACASCHGMVGVPGSATVGPPLEGLGDAAAQRIEGQSAEQYLYDSIRDPNLFVVENCNGIPCGKPSAMPPFAAKLNPQDMSDLIAYLHTL